MDESPNLSYINKLSRGDTLFVQNLMDIIKKELSRDSATYHSDLKEGNFIKSAEHVHKLAHKIRILGFKKGYKIAEQYSADLLKRNLKLKLDFENILKTMLLFVKNVQQ